MLSQKNKQGWRNPWVIGFLVIIFSGVLINTRMIWNMVHHPMRLLDGNYSVKNHGKHDAVWVQQQAERSTLGWKAKLQSPQQLKNDGLATDAAARFILVGNVAQIGIDLRDRDGQPVQGGKIKISAQWPGDPTFDFDAPLYEAAAGNYSGELKFSRSGNWDLLITVTQNEREFEMEQKVFVAFAK